MYCLTCELGEGERDSFKFCDDCKDAYDIDVYSRPLNDAAYHILKLYEILCKKRRDDTLTPEEKVLVKNSHKFQSVLAELWREE